MGWEGKTLLNAIGSLVKRHQCVPINFLSWKDMHEDYITDMVELIKMLDIISSLLGVLGYITSSYFISIFHGTLVVLLSFAAIFSASDRGFSAANMKFQNIVLDLNAAYFAVDLLHLVAFFNGAGDLPFVLHQLATLVVLLTCRHATVHGVVTVLALLALAEATSALQNAWALGCARRRSDSSSVHARVAERACDAVSVSFYGMYSVVRGLLRPYVVFRMVFYSRGGAEGAIATWIWVSWVVVVSMAIAWVSNLWIEVQRERSRKVEQKIR
ncbi:TLC domain-containing protein [Glycine soja]